MKKYISISIISFLISYSFSYSQKSEFGIYLTSNDYKNNHLSYPSSKFKKIKLHPVINTSTIELINEADRITLKKDSIFGYKNNGGNYRFYNQKEYKIIHSNNNNFLIYSKVSFPKGKGNIQETHYFFSTEIGNHIQELSLSNLKKAFPTNSKFHDLLDQNFKNDSELMNYDEFYKEYKLMKILKASY